MTISRRQFCVSTSAVAALSCAGGRAPAPAPVTPGGITRRDHRIAGEGAIRLAVREVTWSGANRAPLLLLHGLRVPSAASFDLPVPGGSLAADLAAAGHPVFLLDARGYGGSTRPAGMEGPPDGGAPLVRSSEVVRDIVAAVEWIRARLSAPRVALFGWATGGHWLGHYTSLYSDRASHLIMLNTLYGGTPDHPTLGRGSDLEDPARPGQFNRTAVGAYRLNPASSLTSGWSRGVPADDQRPWRDPAVAEAYVAAAVASDPTSASRTPASFRSPSGGLEDSFYLATGRQLWDASLITSPTLVIRSEHCFWSRPEDPKRLADHLVHAARVEIATLAGATHFVHLDLPERGRARLLQTVTSFLAS
jgi:pimeloyl-ACP methyl ester carboxylesterase